MLLKFVNPVMEYRIALRAKVNKELYSIAVAGANSGIKKYGNIPSSTKVK